MSVRARSVESAREGSGPDTPASVDPWLLDSREVSNLLGIGRTKVFQMMARAELPVVHMGRCVRVPRQALQDWVQNRTLISIREPQSDRGARMRQRCEMGDREL